MKIRRATNADMREILRIEKRSFGADAWDREYFEEYLEFPRETYFLVAVVDESIAGYAVAVKTLAGAELESIAVLPSKRRHGVACALLGRIFQYLRRGEGRTFTLMVRRENRAAIALYRSFGFKRVRRINGYYPDGAAAWRMRAEIQPAT